jgi:uncharacterized protein YacL
MFVEIVRLLITVLSTAAGYELTSHGSSSPSGLAILGATLGALFGYVLGGIFGRLLGRAMGSVEDEVAKAPAAQLLAGAIGALALGVLSALLGVPAVALIPGHWGWAVYGLLVWVGLYEGYALGGRKSAELLGLAGLSTRPLLTPYGETAPIDGVLVDTSAIVDGRLLSVAEAGFLQGNLLVARFVLDELQSIADSADETRRRRGRRGVEALEVLRRLPGVGIEIVDHEVPEFEAVDAKLVALARRLKVGLVTTDFNLQRVAELQGVRCLNVNRLAQGLRPAVLPGEVVQLPIAREGKEPGQGVGFLEDGTMVVVGGAADMVGRDVAVRITSNVQTSVGRMLFASVEAD